MELENSAKAAHKQTGKNKFWIVAAIVVAVTIGLSMLLPYLLLFYAIIVGRI